MIDQFENNMLTVCNDEMNTSSIIYNDKQLQLSHSIGETPWQREETEFYC